MTDEQILNLFLTVVALIGLAMVVHTERRFYRRKARIERETRIEREARIEREVRRIREEFRLAMAGQVVESRISRWLPAERSDCHEWKKEGF